MSAADRALAAYSTSGDRSWTKSLRRDIDARTGSTCSAGSYVLDDVDRHEAAAVAGDACEEGRAEDEIAVLLAAVAPVVLDGTTYRVIHSVRRPCLASDNVDLSRDIVIMTLLGPRGGVSHLHHNVRREGAEHIPLAWHTAKRRWYYVVADGTYRNLNPTGGK